jgi:uncharacterized protein (DUF1697 family)
MNVFLALLRAIGPTTHKVLTMSQLQMLCQQNGLPNTRNVLATGNLVIATDWPLEQVRSKLEQLLANNGLSNAVLMRTEAELELIITSNPLPQIADSSPSQFQVTFLRQRPSDETLKALKARANTERIERVVNEICIDYAGRISDSKLTTALIERTLKTTGTARNWNTLLKLQNVARAMRTEFVSDSSP